MTAAPAERLEVAIVGAGLAGLCLAIKLKQAGVSSFALFEKSTRLGGTWRDNTYPGAACDVPSHLYAFSFARKRDWSRKFAGQSEILGYAEGLVRDRGLGPHLRLGAELASARFDAAAKLWRLRTAGGDEIEAKALVSACGQLNRPHSPVLPGRDDFAGPQFHSARWTHGVDLAGKRIAVIGNGASAVQFIPQIAPSAERLYVFQRSANWIVPLGDRPYAGWERWAFAHLPLLDRLYRYSIYWSFEGRFFAFSQGSPFGKVAEGMARRHLRRQVADAALQRKLTPDYPIGCKRILLSDDYYPTLQRPNVELVTEPIERLTASGVITADGTLRPLDVVIYATGFDAAAFMAPLAIFGAEGLAIERAWAGGAEAHLGITVPGFPNFFLMYGPNTNLGHNSIVFMIECQASYIMACLRPLLAGEIATLEVTPAALARFRTRLDRDLQRRVWAAGCRSWYKTADGKIINNWSGFTVDYWWRTRRPDFADFRIA